MVKLQIHEGRHLVAILGTGLEQSNSEALIFWVDQMLPMINLEPQRSREYLEVLAKQLATILLD